MIYEKVSEFYDKYKEKKCIIGYSFKERNLYALHVGSDFGKQFIAVYAVHAREWITSLLALKHIKTGVCSGGWVIPLLNPDGVNICETRDPLWKANARGVDLNCNFDADWGQGRLNTKVRGAENCIGDFAASEPETEALVRFTRRIKPAVTLSFHTKGGEIYWEYDGKGDKGGAEIISRSTGYIPKIITGSCGGYKDWCIKKLNIPSYTVECGDDSLSHPIKKLTDIKECYNILKDFTNYYGKK